MARSGGSRPAVLGGASRRESWLAVRRAAQSLCSAWGGDDRPARTRRRTVHNEASQRRTVVASACFGQLFAVAVGDGGLTAATSRNGAGVERRAGVVEAEAERRSRQVKTKTERRQAGK
jgi:hypothetical protein